VTGDRLAGRVAIVTGGGTGIGRAIATRFAAEGALLMLAGVDREPLAATAQDLRPGGADCEVFVGDLSEPAVAGRMRDAALGRFGRIDVLVNNAGAA
jgi:NAD(P)-dependent dehydrogenase (short-subunit alcohol dehydrogenase family)